MGKTWITQALVFTLLLLVGTFASAQILYLGYEEIVQTEGVDLQVDAYSVPCLADWNGDDLPDLLVGEGGIIYPGTVHLFLNVGALGEPSFSGAGHIQAGEVDLEVPGTGCLGAFPRVVFWNNDTLPDLLVGDAYGQVSIFLNEGVSGTPALAEGILLEFGPVESKTIIDVGGIATPIIHDWNEDGRRDLIVGAYDGRLHIFINEGLDTEPDFLAESFAQTSSGDLVVSGGRASPVILDLDEDGIKDLLSGNTLGEILVYTNIGTNAAPLFDGYTQLESGGVPIDFDGTPRTRPFVCDWTGDGLLDLLTGLSDGRVHLFQGHPTAVPETMPMALLHRPWPNPANPSVNVSFTLEEAGHLNLSIHNVQGQHLSTLSRGYHEAGRYDHVWNGRKDDGQEMPSGVYFITLKSHEMVESRRVVLLR